MKHSLLRLLTTMTLAFSPALISMVGAHAFLDHAAPAAGSTVRESPPRLKLWFSQRLERPFSTVRVLTPTGKQIDNRDSEVDRADARLLSVSLPKLSPGTYRVQWRVLSVDSHVSEGHFTFDVRP